jgi:protein-disulfide isomerase
VKRRHRLILVAAVVAAVAAAAGLIALSATSADTAKRKDEAVPAASLPVAQHGIILGSSSARVTLVEFADLQCPYCGEFSRLALPEIVRDYVATGRVRIVFQGLAFLGRDSRTALRAVLAAGLQNHAWDMLEGLYRAQGAENGGWVTRRTLRDVGAGIDGLNTARMFRDMNSRAVARQMRDAKAMATQARVNGTPSFFVGPSGGMLEAVRLSSIGAAALRPSLDAALSG